MNIVFLDEYSLGGIDLSRIKQLGNYTGYEKTTPGEIAERCIDADIVITNKVPLRAEAIKVLPQLKLICIAATGMNNVDLEAAAERGIEVRNAVGYSTHAVTETTIGAAIALLRQSIYYDRYVKSGEYAASDAPFHFGRPLHQLYGKRWGIIGLGAIGHKVAEVAAALGCQIAYTSTSGVERQDFLYSETSPHKNVQISPTASLSCFYLPLWGMPCPHIVQEGANGIDVGPLIQSPSLVLFGGCKAFCSIANRSFLAQRRQCRLIKINQF